MVAEEVRHVGETSFSVHQRNYRDKYMFCACWREFMCYTLQSKCVLLLTSCKVSGGSLLAYTKAIYLASGLSTMAEAKFLKMIDLPGRTRAPEGEFRRTNSRAPKI